MQGYRACVSWFYHEDFLERFDGLKPVSGIRSSSWTATGSPARAGCPRASRRLHCRAPPQTWPQPLGDAVDEEIDDVVLGQIAARDPSYSVHSRSVISLTAAMMETTMASLGVTAYLHATLIMRPGRRIDFVVHPQWVVLRRIVRRISAS